MKEIKLGDVASVFQNSKNKQYSLVLKSRQMKKRKITPEQLLEMNIPKIKVKFYKGKKEKKD